MSGCSGGMRSPKQQVNLLIDTGARLSNRLPAMSGGVMKLDPDRPPVQRRRATTWVLDGRGRARGKAVAQARDHVREFLAADGHAVAPGTLRDSLLVVSELVTNAVVHAPGPCVLHVGYDHGALAIAVRDTSPALPVPRVPNPAAADGGFGWHLLTSLTSRIDVQPHADGGKTVTAVLHDGQVP